MRSYWSEPAAKRWHLLAAYVAVVIAVTLALFFVAQTANRAADRANRALIQNSFSREQVCSRTHQGVACQDLFDRLAGNITPQQRYRLGCAALEGLHTPGTKKLVAEAHCPVLHPSP